MTGATAGLAAGAAAEDEMCIPAIARSPKSSGRGRNQWNLKRNLKFTKNHRWPIQAQSVYDWLEEFKTSIGLL
jgi:hypothetical protein